MRQGQTYQSPSKTENPNRFITVGDLETFKQELLHSLQFILTKAQQPGKKWMKSYEVKKMLGISAGTLQTLRNNGTITFSRVGGTLYYDPADIEKLIQSRKINFSLKRKNKYQ